jgi:hypothetical protein
MEAQETRGPPNPPATMPPVRRPILARSRAAAPNAVEQTELNRRYETFQTCAAVHG